VWKKKYFEEKKKTVSLEERCNQLRYEVEVIHKKILSSGDGKGTQMTTSVFLASNILLPVPPDATSIFSIPYLSLLIPLSPTCAMSQ
jgi:hypothetical protein